MADTVRDVDTKDVKDVEDIDLDRVSTSHVGQSNGAYPRIGALPLEEYRLIRNTEYTEEQYKKLTRKIDRYLIPVM